MSAGSAIEWTTQTTTYVVYDGGARTARILAAGPERAREIADRRYGVGRWMPAVLAPPSGEPTEEIVDMRGYVVCDVCNDDYSLSDAVGGIAIDTYSICPRCAPKALADARRCGETDAISARAMPGETFRAFVERMRGDFDFSIFSRE